MQEGNSGGKILAMYDVRGIQSFIFRTNKVKEIMGASLMVEGIIEKALEHGLGEVCGPEEQYIVTWEKDEELQILSDDNIAAQVLFIGGGNAYVMYRDRELAVTVNRKMARYVLDETYSLQLAVAMVDKTDSYANDYRSVQDEMFRIKACMPYSGCLGAPSVVAVDDLSGFPYSISGKEKLSGRQEYGRDLSYESIRKLAAYYKSIEEGKEKEHDNLVTEYGRESTLAVVHIDGNNMGMRIRNLMQDETDYEKAVKKMRAISKNINSSFKETFETVRTRVQDWVSSPANTVLKKKDKDGQEAVYIRKILVAGDDITFVCNAGLALPIVEFFAQDVSAKVMYGDAGNEKDIENYGFSVCAGLAYVHSHFPFHTAYEVAEECCSSAKKRAKEEGNKLLTVEGQERIANWVDFQICRSVHNIDLEKSREKNYTLSEGESLLRRPYYIEVMRPSYENFNVRNAGYSYRKFKAIMDYFKYNGDMPRSLAKEFRNTYPLGRNAVEELVEFARSRKKLTGAIESEGLSGTSDTFGYVELGEKHDKKLVAAWYDALEMMDYYISAGLEASAGKEA